MKKTKKQKRIEKIREDQRNHKVRMKKYKEAKIFTEKSKNPLDTLFN